MKKPAKTVSAPGRICLFGEHSDYLGLPVMTMAINRRMTIDAFRRRDRKFRVLMPDIREEDIFTPSAKVVYRKERDYLRAGVNVLKRRGYRFSDGYDFLIRSDIPINSGTSSSSAMVVAWLKMLLSFQKDLIQFDPIRIAWLAYETEVLEFKEAGGRMDHFAITFGGTMFHENHKTVDIRFLSPLKGMILGDSLEKKETVRDLKRNARDVREGFRMMKKKIRGFHQETVLLKEILEKFKPQTAPLRKAIGTLRNRDICRGALKEMVLMPIFPRKIGRLMNEHHLILRCDLKISTPKIEAMIAAALSAGAIGAKINGSGLGGTMIAYAPGKEKKVVAAIEKAGGDAVAVDSDRGVLCE